MRITDAPRVRGTALLLVGHLVGHGAVRLAPRQSMVPDDEVEALAARDVVRAVAPRAEMYDARAHSMVVRMLVAPVVRRADHPTENQTTPLEVPPQTHVERHCEDNCRVDGVAVRAIDAIKFRTPSHRPSESSASVAVLVRPIFHDEGVRRIEARRRVAPVVCRNSSPRER